MVRSALLVVLTILWPVGAASQVVVGLAADAESGAPLGGAFVTLSDEDGVPRARSLTNSSGRFTLRAPASGRYHLRVERIGYAAAEQSLVVVEPGPTAEVTFRLAPRAIPLEGITVEATSRCEIRPETGRLTARLWDDVGTALRVARWSESEGLLRFRLVKWERELDPRSLEIREESRNEEVRTLDRSPFASRPASELQELGYVREDEDGYLSFYAPDAAVLLSDEFLDGHCFRARTDDPPEDGWIGLAFEPVERSSFADVEGVLWVDASTSELQRLDYSYTRLPANLRDDRMGGQVDFDRIPEGPWIVSRWAIRMPEIETRRIVVRTYTNLISIKEAGGEVLEVWVEDDAPVPEPGDRTTAIEPRDAVGPAAAPRPGVPGVTAEAGDSSIVTGTVLAEDSGQRVSTALVGLLGPQGDPLHTARSDTSGVFELTAPGPGRYRLHVEAFGFSPTETEAFLVGQGDTVSVDVRLAASPFELDPLVVSVFNENRAGFEQRKDLSYGMRLGPDLLAERGDLTLNEFTARRAPFLSWRPFEGLYVPQAWGRRCSPMIFIDGKVLRTASGIPPELDRWLDPNDVRAVEVYQDGSSLPAPFYGLARAENGGRPPCGVVAVWTTAGFGEGETPGSR